MLTMRKPGCRLLFLAVVFLSTVPAVSRAAGENRVRTGLDALSPAEVTRLAQFYETKKEGNLYESDPQFAQQVVQRAGAENTKNVDQARGAIQQYGNQQLQSVFLQAVRDVKNLVQEQTKDPVKFAANYGGEATTQIDSQIKFYEAAAANGDAGAKERAAQYEQIKSGSQALHSLVQTVNTYGELSDKVETVRRDGGVAPTVDVSADVMKNFLENIKKYTEVLSERKDGQLSELAPLGQPIPGLTGPGGEQKIEQVLGLERDLQQLQNVGYYIDRATERIDQVNTIVKGIDAAVNNPDYERIRNNEYLSPEAQALAQNAVGTGRAIQELAGLMGGPEGEIVKMSGQGIELIGRAAEMGGALENIKQQGGRMSESGEFQGRLEDFQNANLTVRQDMGTGDVFVPDGTGRGEVQINQEQLGQLRDAVSAFSSLTGRNPTQEELAILADGRGFVDVGGDKMNRNMLSDPHNRTDFDLRGAERADLNGFLQNATAGVEPDKMQRYGTDGTKGPMTPEDHKDRLDQLNQLSQQLYGHDVTPNMYGADLQNDGALRERMERELAERERKKKEEEDLATVKNIKKILADEAAEKQRVKDEAERKRREEEETARKEEEERKRKEDEQRKKDEEDAAREKDEEGGTTELVPDGGGAQQEEAPCGGLFDWLSGSGTPDVDSGSSAFDQVDKLNQAQGGTHSGPDTRDFAVGSGTQQPVHAQPAAGGAAGGGGWGGGHNHAEGAW